jgi:hypothetical protein
MSHARRTLMDLNVVRDQAEALLRALQDAKVDSEKRLTELKQPDALKAVTGRSAMDNAIASTQRMIETLNRAAGDLRRDLTEADLKELDGSV